MNVSLLFLSPVSCLLSVILLYPPPACDLMTAVF